MSQKIERGVITPNSKPQAIFDYACDLEAQVQALSRCVSTDTTHLLQAAFKLTGQETRMLMLLSDGHMRSKSQLLDGLYWDRANEVPEIKIIDVFVCKVRKKIAGSGIDIETSWGLGYSLTGGEVIAGILAGKEPKWNEEFRQAQIGRHAGAAARKKGSVRDAALAYLREHADLMGHVKVTSRELSQGADVNNSGSVVIRNLERAGRLKVLDVPRSGKNKLGPWLLKLAEAA